MRTAFLVISLAIIVLAAAQLSFRFGPASAGQSPSLRGDANCDGTVSSIDAVLLLQYDAGLVSSLPCEQNADGNCDGVSNSLDATFILQYDAGLISSLPCENSATPPGVATPTPTPTAMATVTQGEVSTRNSSWYGWSGRLRVVGEVYNGLDHPISGVAVTAELYSSTNTLLGTGTEYACVYAIAEHSVSPFSVTVSTPPDEVDHVQLRVTDFSEGPEVNPVVGLDATITNVYTDVYFVHVIGTVTNNSSNTYGSVRPCVAFHNAAGDVVSIYPAYARPDTLAPGETGIFDAYNVVEEGRAIVSERVWVDARY